MKHSMVKKVSVMVCVIMMFTMILGTGSVFANGRDQGPPAPGRFLRIEAPHPYVLVEEGYNVRIPVVAVHENRSFLIDPSECSYSVDHPEIVSIEEDGYAYALSAGVATITVIAQGSQAQITIEVRARQN